jgi:hypothetical protein
MNASISNATASRGVFAPGARLTAAVVAIAAVWLLVLPRIAALPAVRATIQRNEAAGVDPAAKFYTEVPAMPRLLEQVRRARNP